MLKRLRHRLEYALVLAAIAALGRWPLARVQGLGRALGRLAYRLGIARRDARLNLEQRLGVRDPQARDRILRGAYEGFGQTMTELIYMPAISDEGLKALFDFKGLEQLHAIHASGRGIVCLSAHFGNWEWMGAALVQQGLPVTFLIGTQSNPWVDQRFNAHRAAKGMRMTRIADIRGALKVLKGGGLVAILHDQDGDKWGTFVPFFGAQASTHSIGVMLARRSGAAIAYGVPVRTDGSRSEMQIHFLPEPPEGLNEQQATAWTLARYNELLEADIRRHPDRWLWMHHRWSSIPEHRLSGEDRRRAQLGEIRFDDQAQCWRDAQGGEVRVEGWR
jgi:Kdo2-lipid IVA lauroyltransferase/acyltransferase